MAAASCPSCSASIDAARCVSCGAAARAGPFQIVSVLAQSPHGRTYRAQGPGGLVALKELVFALVPTAQQLDAFEREARLLASVSHPQIPRFIDSFREGEGPALRLYLAQELIAGEPLSARIGIDEPEARLVARQLLVILRYLHERGIVHRDVKPANILRRPDGTLVLVDFGAARALAGVTHGATLVGTFGYMPPEQLGGTVDATADLYAVGATLVHLLGRKAPEDILGPDLELRLDHLQVSPGFRAFLARLTAPKRTSRPASAVEALLALDAPPPKPRTRKASWLLPAAAAMVVVAGAILLQRTVDSLIAGSRADAARRRAQLEAIQREIEQPPRPVQPKQPTEPDHRDVSIGRLLDGAKLREIDPRLPSCFRQAGIELARIRIWPAQKALQLKLVQHCQDSSCDWMSLQVAASAESGRGLHPTGAMGETARDGWREILYNFELPEGVQVVRLDLKGPSQPLESWRIGLDRREVRRVGYGLRVQVDGALPALSVATANGCARLEGGKIQTLWIEQDGDRKRLQLTAVFSRRTDRRERCSPSSRLALLDAGERMASTVRLDERTASFTLALPAGRERIRVALGADVHLRLDLREATAEQEAFAAASP